MSKLDRRTLLASTVAVAATGAAGRVPLAGGASSVRPRPSKPLGSGGTPITLAQLPDFVRRWGKGYPVLVVDLAALDQNIGVVTGFAQEQGWAVRPALKSYRSPQLIRYILQRLPEPKGLVFNLSEVDPIYRVAPRGTELMTGYPPTFGELRAFLRQAPRGRRRQRVRILIDSLPLMEELARQARSSRRPLPIDVALELDVGMGRGGMNNSDGGEELGACLDILRAERKRLRLGAVLGYDGHATLDGDSNYRKLVATQSMQFYNDHLDRLAALGADLYDEQTLIRNGPGSSNYRNWVGGPINEISTGSALLFAGYLEGGYDTEGLAPALYMGGSVRRITSDHPSAILTGESPPNATEMEIIVQGIGTADEVIHPPNTSEDTASGGGDALVVPKGSVELGDYVVFHPHQTEVAVQKFASMLAVRNGTVRRRWAVLPRPGSRARER